MILLASMVLYTGPYRSVFNTSTTQLASLVGHRL
jgi:hypothetical protein